jgi:protein-S-isoprenylcysteine O-methyltransferase Ste14
MWWIWLRTLFFAFTFVAFALVLVPRWILGDEHQLASGPLLLLGVILLALGFALMIWCWSEFARRGRGTPAPFDPPRQLVIAGPYRYVRNPMYVAGMLVILGQASLYRSVALVGYAAIFLAASFAFVVGYEEQTLARRFGSEYAAYKGEVRRWIPKLHPYAR